MIGCVLYVCALLQALLPECRTFDGYRTCIDEQVAALPSSFSLSAWIAPQEYSWRESAIVNWEDTDGDKFFLGIDDVGHVIARFTVDSMSYSCVSGSRVPLLEWSHLAVTVGAEGEMSLFVNSKREGKTDVPDDVFGGGPLSCVLGRTLDALVPSGTERASSMAQKIYMYYDGLMDEVCIHEGVMSDDDIASVHDVRKGCQTGMKYRRLPSGDDRPMPFGAYYTRLEYSEGWDANWKVGDYPDIVVRFGEGNPTKLVFWRGTGYIPALVTENDIWMTDQSVENFYTGECYEAMGDKQCRYSHVRIIENTPARVVVHWRYALAGITHEIYHETASSAGEWVDEYWTAYPDGVIARNQILWSDFKEEEIRAYQFQETIFFNQPGSRPEDTVEYEAITFVDMDGSKYSYSWENGIPKSFPDPEFKPIQLVNTKSVHKPFGIYDLRRVTFPFYFGNSEGYSQFPCWNHWPVSQIASDGRKTRVSDKVSHSSLTQVNCDMQIYERRNDGSVRVASMMGMTTGPAETLLPLARSWNNPAEAGLVSSGFEIIGYDRYQRAYLFRQCSDQEKKLDFVLNAGPDSPLENVAIVVEAQLHDVRSVRAGGRRLKAGEEFLTGHVAGNDDDKMVIWLNLKAQDKTRITVDFK